MRKLFAVFTVFLTGLPLFVNAVWAANEKKDDDRLKNCGSVLHEILDVPDSIPQDLLDKAHCVVVFLQF